jgi:uncharacterized protein YndB with AHSA1/START domain
MVEPRNTDVATRTGPNATRSPNTGFVLTRQFRVPREELWSACTDPKKLALWWGPTGATNPICELDPRPNGALRIHTRNADGSVFPITGTVREVDAPRKFVFVITIPFDAGAAPFEMLHTLQFAEREGTTTLTLEVQALQSTSASHEWLAGANLGWSESLERLAELVGPRPGERAHARA